MRKRKPAAIPTAQRAIIVQLVDLGAVSELTAVKQHPAWSANDVNRLHGRGFVRKADGCVWVTEDGAKA